MIEAGQFFRQRDFVAQNVQLEPSFVPNVLGNAIPTIAEQQLATFTDHHTEITAELTSLRRTLVESGIESPSPLRVRAEFVKSIGDGWVNFAQTAFNSSDYRTYIVFTDLGMGTTAIAAAITEGDAINNNEPSEWESDQSATVLRELSEFSRKEPDITSDIERFFDQQTYINRCAQLLREDPTGERTVLFALETVSIPKEEDPAPLPFLSEFTQAGAHIAIKLLEELRKIQAKQ